MKKFFWIVNVLLLGLLISACNDVRRSPGRAYMPDMSYSVAVETYSQLDTAKFTQDSLAKGNGKIYYTFMPVPGTMAREDISQQFPYALDKPGDSTNYVASKSFPNPLPALTPVQMKEAERLYLVNCGICHGEKLDGKGVLWKEGDGAYTAAPKNLIADPIVSNMPDGQMFYSITYGKNMMGPYGSQVTSQQRWAIVHYIKSKISASKGGSTAVKDTTAAGNNAATTTTAATPK